VKLPRSLYRPSLLLRIGIHSGFPETFEGSWHGTDVDTAARVEATATDRQILLSSRTYELVRHITDLRFHPCGEFALKGVDRVACGKRIGTARGRPTAVTPLGVIKRRRTIKISAAALVALIAFAVGTGYLILKYTKPHSRGPFPPPARRSVAVLGFKNSGTGRRIG